MRHAVLLTAILLLLAPVFGQQVNIDSWPSTFDTTSSAKSA